jgi:HSP20 family molecular chaperone IbpA
MTTAAVVEPTSVAKAVPEAARPAVDRIRVAPDTVAYVENHRLVVEFSIPGAPTETIDLKMLEDGVYLTAPAKDIEYAAALALGWPVKPGNAVASYLHGLLRIEVPLKDPMEGAVKVVIKPGEAATITDSAKNTTLKQ